MSGIPTTLAEMTQKFLQKVRELPETSTGDTDALALLREFTAKSRSLIYRDTPDMNKDIMLDELDDLSSAQSVDMVEPHKPGTEPVVFSVKVKELRGTRIVIDHDRPPRLGSVLWVREMPFVVLGVEPVWAAAGAKKLYLCFVEGSEQ